LQLDEIQRAARIIYLDSFPLTANGRKVSLVILIQVYQSIIAATIFVGSMCYVSCQLLQLAFHLAMICTVYKMLGTQFSEYIKK